MKNKKEKTNKKFTILGMSIWRVLAYFIIYSIWVRSCHNDWTFTIF